MEDIIELKLRIQQKIDSSENWSENNPVLMKGEMGIESDTRKIKFGDGKTQYNDLPYATYTLTEINENVLGNLNIRNSDGEYSLKQKYFKDGLDYSAQAIGENSVAFGGLRFDYDSTKHTGDITNTAAGNQSFVAGCGNYTAGDWSFVTGKDNTVYSNRAFVSGGANISQAINSEGNFIKEKTNVGRFNAIFGNNNTFKSSNTLKESNLIAGGSNTVDTERSIVVGYNNNVTGHYDAIFGFTNIVNADYSLIGGQNHIVNSGFHLVAGSGNNVSGQYNIASGRDNKNLGWNSAVIGRELIVGEYHTSQTILGQYNDNKSDTVLEIGWGDPDNRKNIFEVFQDGRAKVQSAPIESDDVVRKQELDNSWDEFNLENGTGLDTLVLKYSGEIDETHYASSTTGESDVCLGEANKSSGKRNIIAGKLNTNTSSNTLIVGLRNTVSGNHSIIGGTDNNVTGHAGVTAGTDNTVEGYNCLGSGTSNIISGFESIFNGYKNTQTGKQSFILGEQNTSEFNQTFISGVKNIASRERQYIFGSFAKENSNAVFIVSDRKGPSDAKLIDNNFMVMSDGRAKVYGEPIESDDVVRKLELDSVKTIANKAVVANEPITPGTHTKISYDSKGLVTGGTDLEASDIPSLPTSKITSGKFSDDRIASASIWNAKQNALTTTQLSAVNSGITSTKVETYDGYAETLANKLDKTGGTISGSLIVSQDLIVNGTTSTVEAENLKVADKLIYVAKDNTVALTSPAGLITPKYDGTNNGGIVYDNTGTAYVGDISLDSNGNVDVNNSDLQAIATRGTTIIDENIVRWDNTNKTLVDSGKKIDDLSTATNLENGTGTGSLVQKRLKSDGVTWTTAKAYQGASTAFGGGTQAGRTEEEFNAYFWDSTKNVPLNGGAGKNSSGEILDNRSLTYKKSYSFGVAEGEQTKALGRGSHSEGYYTKTEGDYSHVEGWKTVSRGLASHAEGEQTTASGDFSHAEGFGTSAKGSKSHSEGMSTEAIGDSSHVEGFATRTLEMYQHVEGVYNADNPNALHIVGNGTSENARKNAFEVLKDGRAKVQSAPTENTDVVRLIDLSSSLVLASEEDIAAIAL